MCAQRTREVWRARPTMCGWRRTQGFGDASPHRERQLPHMVAAGSQARDTRKEPHPPVSREMRLFSSG